MLIHFLTGPAQLNTNIGASVKVYNLMLHIHVHVFVMDSEFMVQSKWID